MKNIFVAVLITLACSSCAYFYHPTHTAYDRMVASWVGRGTADLYEEWGYPQSVQSVDDDTYIETYYKDVRYTQVRPVSASVGSFRPFTDKWDAKLSKLKEQPMPKNYNCRTSFIAENGIIVDYSYKGYGCVE